MVQELTLEHEIVPPQRPDRIHEGMDFSGGFSTGGYIARDFVEAKFNASMATAQEMLTKGLDYLDDLQTVISSVHHGTANYTAVGVDLPSGTVGPPPTCGSLTVPSLDIILGSVPTAPTLAPPSLSVTLPAAPTMSGTIDTSFPVFSTPPPSFLPVPTVDVSGVIPDTPPADLVAAISWFEAAYDDTLYSALFARLISDLTVGASGIGGTIEQEIYDRAMARQAIEEDKLQVEIEEYFASTGFDLPTGAMAARLQEHANGRAMRALDLNGKILIEQAELAQKNSQFVITAASQLEGLLRDYASKKNDRSLDYAKAVATNAVAVYAENLKKYIAKLEANKIYVQIQVENLRAVIESNKGLVDMFSAEAQVFGVVVDSIAKKNAAITDVYKAEITGFDAESRALVDVFKAEVQEYESVTSAETNRYKAEVDGFGTETRATTDVFKTRTDAIAASNNVVVERFRADVGGYSAQTNALTEAQRTRVAAFAERIRDARNALDESIANVDASIKAWTAESSLQERVAEATAQIAMQGMASAYGAVNASTGYSYSGSGSVSESWGHSESRSDSYQHSESISAQISDSRGVSNILTHTYESGTP